MRAKGTAGRRPHDLSQQAYGIALQTHVPVSFETGEQGSNRIYFKGRVRITKLTAVAKKAIAGTDNGTITAASAAGALTSGVLTFVASDAIDTIKTASPTGANRIIPAGSYLNLTTAKTTAGGKALVTVEYEPVTNAEAS